MLGPRRALWPWFSSHGENRPGGPAARAQRSGEALTGWRSGPISTQPRSPAEHYNDAERLLAVAESSVTEQIQHTSALIALTHAILTLSPKRARRGLPRHAGNGLPPHLHWGEEQ